ncbi:DUF1993 family protein [Oxalobacteraceae bacterium A2-2]
MMAPGAIFVHSLGRLAAMLDKIVAGADASLLAAQLHLYILPNFHFHLSMAYAIARQQGVALGKPDYDGYHAYPPGFSFVSNSGA